MSYESFYAHKARIFANSPDAEKRLRVMKIYNVVMGLLALGTLIYSWVAP